MYGLAFILVIHSAYDLGILKLIFTLYTHEIRKIGPKDNSRKWDSDSPVDPETRLHGGGTGGIAEVK